MKPQRRRLALLCLMSSLALAVAGQYYFARRRDFMWDGAFLYALASALFLAAVRLAGPAPAAGRAKPWWSRGFSWVCRHPWRAAMACAGPAISLAVAARAARPLTAAEGYSLLGLWAAGVALFVAATASPGDLGLWAGQLGLRLWAWRWEAGLVALLALVGALARFIRLSSIPYILGGDEASMGREAIEVLRGHLTNPFATGWLSHPTLYFYILASSLRWPGGTVAGLRTVPALAGALTVPALYLLARELFGRRVAFLSAAYLACYPYAIHFSRLALNNAIDPLLATLAFALLFVGLRTGRARYLCFALAGALLGLALYFYMGSRAMPIVMVALVLLLAWREPGFCRAYGGALAVLAGAFLVTGGPLLAFFARHPQDFMARVNQLGIVQSGWLAETSASLQRSPWSLLWEQFVKSALAFHCFSDPGAFYGPGMPLLDFASAIPFTFGLVYSMAHWRERRHAVAVLWFWAIIILGGVLMENPPSAQRLVLTVVPVSLFIALGLTQLVGVVQRALGWQAISGHILAGLAVAALGTIGLEFYFGPYTASHVYPGLNTEVGHEMGLYLARLGPGYRYYFYGAPRMFAGFPNVRYLAPDVEGVDVMPPPAQAPEVKGDRRPVFIFLPERLGELEGVRATYPNGVRTEFRQPAGELLFVSYEPD